MWHGPRLRLAGALVAAAALTAAVTASEATAAGPGSGAARANSTALPVIVQARAGHSQQAASAVRAAGGQVGRGLPIVDGFAARLPAAGLRQLATHLAIRQITPNSNVRFSMQAADAASAAAAPLGSNYPASTGATSAWALGERGAGITVAVIDTGISPVPDLAGRVIAGPDFSGERNSLRDSYGHGTVMAGVIAGDGASSSDNPDGAYVGMAPQAKVLSVKVAGRTGATDVSTMLAAMQWVGSHQDQHQIRALNLSWGTTSDQSPSVDPLNFAVQRLWRSGIVVVAAAGNDGPTGATITKPGDDPVIITAGAYDDRQNTSPTDDFVTAWSSRGPTAAGAAKPDVIAPGRTIVATRAPGSYIEANNPQAHIGSAYIRGSGTSQASAVTAGAVALLLGRRDALTPDQVKHAITVSAVPIYRSSLDGHGRVAVMGTLQAAVRSAPVQAVTATGLGSLEASRGGRHVVTVCARDTAPTVITGEMDALCQPWDGDTWTGDTWTTASWLRHIWSGDTWTGDTWTGDTWTGDTWTGTEFLTAFWGAQPRWWQKLPGETSASPTSDSPTAPGQGN